MSINKRPGGPYVVPLLTDDGSEAVAAGERGKYTLAANKTYVCPLGGIGAPTQSVQITGDAAVILTLTIEECNADVSEISDTYTAADGWTKDNGSAGVTSGAGTGWTPTARTVAVAGGNVGSAMFQLPDRGAARTRLTIVVGGTGGVVRVGAHGKG